MRARMVQLALYHRASKTSSALNPYEVTSVAFITVFLNCLHTFSESMPHILRTLHTNPKKNTLGKTSQFSCKMKLYIQNNVFFFSKLYFVFKWHTQTIICIDIYKNQLNTDVLNVKHYDECKTLLLHSS